MRHRSAWPILGLLAGVLACGDGGTSPGPVSDAAQTAARFDQLADSVEQAGFSPSAEALRHAAEIVRLTGRATPVTLTIDGTARNFLAVGEQIDFPLLACSWSSDSGTVGPGDSVVSPPPSTPAAAPECVVMDTTSMRTLIAWEPERLSEVVRIVSDVGSTAAEPGVPDVMVGLPTALPTPPDSIGGSGGGSGGGIVPPGFMGEYLVGDVGSWYAVEGSQSNALLAIAGACTAAHATFDWARFACEAARLRFEFAMRVEPVSYTPLMGRTPTGVLEGSHELSLTATDVDGVRLTVEAWTPPPPVPIPGPPVPVDSTLVEPQ